jgi:hypothetical protein
MASDRRSLSRVPPTLIGPPNRETPLSYIGSFLVGDESGTIG